MISTQANAAAEAASFQQGSVRMSIMLGSGTAFQQDYTILGIGLGYYVADGIEAGVDIESWHCNDPRITRLSPQVLYVHQMTEMPNPMPVCSTAGPSSANTIDINNAGARTGLLFLYGRKASLGLGLAYESHLNCDRTVYDACADTYPELRVAIMF
jgi:hypothetical protein